jgi:hypothetical protein
MPDSADRMAKVASADAPAVHRAGSDDVDADGLQRVELAVGDATLEFTPTEVRNAGRAAADS